MKKKYLSFELIFVTLIIFLLSINLINHSVYQFLSSDEIFLLGSLKGISTSDSFLVNLSNYFFFIDANIVLENESIYRNPILYSLKVASQTSYAPLSPLINNISFNLFSFLENEVLRLRLINLIFSIFTIFLYLYLTKPLDKIINIFIFIIANSSFLNLYYQSTALPYSLFSFLILLNIIFVFKFDKIFCKYGYNKSLIIYYLIFIISFFNHWSLILINFLTFVFSFGDIKKYKIKLLPLSVLISIIFLSILISYLLFISDDLRFINKRSDFSLETNNFTSFFKIFFMIFEVNFTVSPYDNLNKILAIFGVINLFLFLIISLKKKNKLNYFLILCFFSYLLAGLFEKYPLTPTRHIIVFYPILMTMIFLNAKLMNNYFNLFIDTRFVQYFIFIIIIIFLAKNFIFLNTDLNNSRANYLIDIESNKKINEYIKKYDISKIYGSHDIYNFYYNNKYLGSEITLLNLDTFKNFDENFIIFSYQNDKYGLHDWEFDEVNKRIINFRKENIIKIKGNYFDYISKNSFDNYNSNFDKSSLNYLEVNFYTK